MVIFIRLDRQGKPHVFSQNKDTDVVLIDWRDSFNTPRAKPAISSVWCRGLDDIPQAFVDPDED